MNVLKLLNSMRRAPDAAPSGCGRVDGASLIVQTCGSWGGGRLTEPMRQFEGSRVGELVQCSIRRYGQAGPSRPLSEARETEVRFNLELPAGRA
jgi:hypothetical protein